MRAYTLGLSLLLFLTNGQVCKAQLPLPKIDHYGIENGYFSQTGINDIQTDSSGTLWIISFGDITKFNGSQFGTINSNTVKHSSFIRFYNRPNRSPFVTDYLGRVFFIEQDTLRPYDYNDTLVQLNRAYSCSDIYFDTDDNLHVAFRNTGYRIIGPDGSIDAPFEHVEKARPEGFTATLRNDELPFISLEPQSEHTGSAYMIFTLVNEDLEILDSITLPKTSMRFPQSVIRLPSGNFLLSSGWGHLIEFDDHQVLRTIPYDHPVVHIFTDSKDGIWIGTTNNGLHYYKDGIISKENKRCLLATGFAAATTQDHDGGVWIHSNTEGLSHIANPEQFYYNIEDGGVLKEISCKIELANGSLITSGVDGALASIDLENYFTDQKPIPIETAGAVQSVLFDSTHQRTWIAKDGKIYFLDKGQSTWSTLNLQGLDNTKSTSRIRLHPSENPKFSFIGMHDKQIFLVTDTVITYISPISPTYPIEAVMRNDSIWYHGEGKLQLLVGDRIEDIGKGFEELQDGSVHYITSFDGTICLSMRPNGTYTLVNGELRPLVVDGIKLPYGVLHTVNSKEMWLISLYGNFLIEKKKGAKPSTWSVSSYKAFESISNELPKSNESTLFWGFPNNKVFSVDFDDLKKDTLKPPILRFSELKIKRERVPIGNKAYEIGYDDRHIQISYEGISYQQGSLEYRYWLKGFENEWTQTRGKSIQYTTLPAGNYTYEVQARKLDGFWSDSKTLSFKVAPPYWQTWWFIASCSLFGLLILYIIGSIRIRVVRKEQLLVIDRLKAEQNALQAQMDPHFVFNILASVQYLVLESTKERVITFLNMFSRSLRNTLDQTRKNSLELKHEIQFLKEYIEMERFRLEDKFDFEIQHGLDPQLLEQLIPPFVIQPFVENAIQHGLKNKTSKGHLSLSFSVEGSFFKILITDNGIGRKAAGRFKKENGSHNGKSHGIDIISQRLSLYNDKKENVIITDLTSDNGEALGTQVLIFIKRKDHESTHH